MQTTIEQTTSAPADRVLVGFLVDPTTKRALRRRAAQNDHTLSDELRIALDRHLNDDPKDT